jgi:5-methylthioadenosine/S-adenosylhomocysteine deaminase
MRNAGAGCRFGRQNVDSTSPATFAATEADPARSARALGLERDIGSLEPDKQADVIAVDLGAVAHAPCYDPVSHLVHVTGRDQVTDVWVAGRRVVAERRLTSVDTDELAARVRFWQDRLQSQHTSPAK